ncbi:MAG: hypothetical protein ACE5I3_02155 [Phycisphaerae bacterium]
MRGTTYLTFIAALPLATAASGQSSIHPGYKFAWAENIGWTNWRDANNASAGVAIGPTFLSGFIWAENAGWINIGDGLPADGVHYANHDGSDFGVNLDPDTGDLFGLGWGENVGWINFDTRDKGEQRARFDEMACRFRGYAWAENVGWINLDDEEHFVALLLDGDLDYDGDVDLSDLAQLLGHYGTSSGAAWEDGDIDGDGDVDLSDLAALLAEYGETCP